MLFRQGWHWRFLAHDLVPRSPEFDVAIRDSEQNLSLQNHLIAVVFHEREGRRHGHVVWSRINPMALSQRMPHFKSKLKTISRNLFLEHDWKLPDGFDDENRRASLNHGYAVTIHKSQSAMVDQTWLYVTQSMDHHLM